MLKPIIIIPPWAANDPDLELGISMRFSSTLDMKEKNKEFKKKKKKNKNSIFLEMEVNSRAF